MGASHAFLPGTAYGLVFSDEEYEKLTDLLTPLLEPSMLGERLGYSLFRDTDLVVPRAAHARVYTMRVCDAAVVSDGATRYGTCGVRESDPAPFSASGATGCCIGQAPAPGSRVGTGGALSRERAWRSLRFGLPSCV